MQNFFIKSTALAIALACNSCVTIPIPIPVPIPIETSPKSSTPLPETQQILQEKYKKTCYADALTENEGRKITESSSNLEAAGDKLAVAGKHKEAIRKYNEAGAAAMNEAIADGSALDMEIDTFLYSKDEVEAFHEKHRLVAQRSAELNFKVGSSYARIKEYEKAIDCFNGTIKIGILPPNDAVAHLNRGDAYERMGDKIKAKADFQQAVNLFKKYKLASYQKTSEQRLKSIK